MVTWCHSAQGLVTSFNRICARQHSARWYCQYSTCSGIQVNNCLMACEVRVVAALHIEKRQKNTWLGAQKDQTYAVENTYTIHFQHDFR
jgi:hypothetical protein